MEGLHSVLDRDIPDATSTVRLDRVSAAEVDLVAGRTDRWTEASVSPGLRARALLVAGRPGDAATALGEVRSADIEPTSPTSRGGGQSAGVQEVASVVWAASRVPADPGILAATRRRLEALRADGCVTRMGMLHDGGVLLGPLPLFEALLDAATGATGHALEAARRAVDVADRRTPFWGAWARIELARLAGGMLDTIAVDDPGVAKVYDERRGALNGARLFFRSAGHIHMAGRCHELDGPPTLAPMAAPGLGHLVRGAAEGDPASWQVGVGVQPPVTIDHGRGLDLLDHLIANRSRSVPAVELVDVLDGTDTWRRIVADVGDDAEALAARIRDDRARSRASKLLARTIKGLSDRHPALAAHLRTRVSTGYVCGYRDETTAWRR